ncbi:class GN sortase [Sphingobium sp. Sx8-8]|uniref:class GN sortase n=1 Tax=Sphingobium sp. Sx8-8 TaxID=2933617 RepID=UPI001F59A26C|nr:class GN sortase [Sphingobium sp. Sx8-8]
MTGGSLATTSRKGGRAGGRVLSHAVLIGLCFLGLMLMARGMLIPVKAWVAQILLDRAFDQSLLEKRPVKPWSWTDTAPVARITLPRLGVSEIILSGGSGQAMAFGPTLLPIHGQGKVSILAAHRDTHFAFLRQAKVGDVIKVQSVSGQEQGYRITGFQIVRRDRFAYPRDPAHRLLGLTTCYPFGATEHGPLRYVAWAEAS